MKVKAIVDKLLEADDADFDPEQIKDYALGLKDYQLSKMPPEVAGVLEYAPDDFFDAHVEKRPAEWNTDYTPDEWWPSYDDDDETWRKYTYYSEYRTEDGRLYQIIQSVDSDGDHDFDGEAEVGTPVWREMLEPYAYWRWAEQNAAYTQWVMSHGEDPLGFFYAPRVENTMEWLIAFVQDQGRARFWKARQVGDPNHRHEPVEHAIHLPLPVREYINIDANRINQDLDWAGMLELTRSQDRDRPVLRRSGNTEYIQFKQGFTERGEAADKVEQLKAVAKKNYAREVKEARSAKRQHKKMPHYTV